MSIGQIDKQSELTLEAYANLTVNSLSGQAAALKTAGFATLQFQEFVTRDSIFTQYTDPDISFTAIVFKDGNGRLTLAPRGTLKTGDTNETHMANYERSGRSVVAHNSDRNWVGGRLRGLLKVNDRCPDENLAAAFTRLFGIANANSFNCSLVRRKA